MIERAKPPITCSAARWKRPWQTQGAASDARESSVFKEHGARSTEGAAKRHANAQSEPDVANGTLRSHAINVLRRTRIAVLPQT